MSLLLPAMISMAIKRLRDNEPPEGYHLSFSGGKDSIVCHALAVEAGVKFVAHMGLTSVDPPEVLRFVRKEYPAVVLHRPLLSMFQLLEKKGFPPLGNKRYCCDSLKEYVGKGGVVITGIRHAESFRRRTRKPIEVQKKKRGGIFVNPIIEWSNAEVWAYIKLHGLPYPKLYDEGYKRIGCILCPMQSEKNKQRDMRRFPKFVRAYRLAFNKMIQTRVAKGMPCDRMFKDAETCFKWWTGPRKKWEDNQ